MKQPNLGYADVKLVFACMHPAGCGCRVSLCDYYDLCAFSILQYMRANFEAFVQVGREIG